MAFYEMAQDRRLACDECGCMVDGSERGRALHARFHEPAGVLDLAVEEQADARVVA